MPQTRRVLRDVDTSLWNWLAGFLPDGAAVAFDAPTERSGTDPVLGLYLHDVREEGEVTPADWSNVHGDNGHLVGRLPPQRRYRLTYLVTAWAGNALDEHEILGSVLAGCARHHIVPPESLHGSMADLGQPVMVRCAPLDRRCDPKDLWAAWRVPPRTALELSVLAPMPVSLLSDLPTPPRSVSLSSTRPPGGAQGFPDRQRERAGRWQGINEG